MIPALTSQRRAEHFDALVDHRAPAGRASGRRAELAELAALVDQVRSLPEVAPRPEFSSGLREQLLAEANTALAGGPAAPAGTAAERLRLPQPQPRRQRRLATVIGGAAVLGATTSMAVAAQTALPGDRLYPVKLVIEQVETELAGSQHQAAETMLANASGRLTEVNQLSRRGNQEVLAEIPETLEDFSDQSLAAADLLLELHESTGDRESIKQLRDFTHDSMEKLLLLEAQLPDEARNELVAAARTLTRIDDRARTACPACGGEGIASIPRLLLAAGDHTQRPAAPGVPSATLPPVPAGDDTDTADSAPEVTGPVQATDPAPADVDLDAGGHATGDSSGDSGDQGSSGGPTGDGVHDPVTGLTSTVTGDDTTTDVDSDTGGLLEGVGSTVDKTLDEAVDNVTGQRSDDSDDPQLP